MVVLIIKIIQNIWKVKEAIGHTTTTSLNQMYKEGTLLDNNLLCVLGLSVSHMWSLIQHLEIYIDWSYFCTFDTWFPWVPYLIFHNYK